MRSDDLAPLLAAPQGDPTAIRGGQGVVVEWNPLTAENVIRFRGTDLVNLPTHASSTEVLQIKPGDSVVLHIWGSGATATIYVVGRITTPGTPQAGTAMAMFGIGAVTVSAAESTSSTTYTDLATAGPTVIDVLIGATGRCLVTVSADILIGSASAGAHSALMSHTVSGASTRGADDGRSLSVYINNMAAGGQFTFQASRTVMHTGLTPGLHTFTAKYRIFVGGAATFSARNISVVPF